MITRTPDATAPYFDVADPAFSVTSAEVRRAREAGWYARTSYGLAVLRYDQVSRLIRHPALRQGSRLWPAHHGITSGPFADWWASWVLNLEGEAHHRMRRLLSPAFSRRIVEALRPRFGDLAGELAESVPADLRSAPQVRRPNGPVSQPRVNEWLKPDAPSAACPRCAGTGARSDEQRWRCRAIATPRSGASRDSLP